MDILWPMLYNASSLKKAQKPSLKIWITEHIIIYKFLNFIHAS